MRAKDIVDNARVAKRLDFTCYFDAFDRRQLKKCSCNGIDCTQCWNLDAKYMFSNIVFKE